MAGVGEGTNTLKLQEKKTSFIETRCPGQTRRISSGGQHAENVWCLLWFRAQPKARPPELKVIHFSTLQLNHTLVPYTCTTQQLIPAASAYSSL